MGDLAPRIQFWAKRGLAVILFVVLLVGASATAFYVLAAGISALSGFAGRTTMVAPAPFVQQALPPNNGLTNAEPGYRNVVPQTGSTHSMGQPEYQASSMGSASSVDVSVAEAIDGGGFALGAKVQSVFGSLLGGVLDTLFLDQPHTSNPSGGQ